MLDRPVDHLDVWGAWFKRGRAHDVIEWAVGQEDVAFEAMQAVMEADADDADVARRRAFDVYPGGKGASGSAYQIASRFPAHSVYIEPFLGNGAVLRAKRPALASVGIDLDREVVDRWRALRWPGLRLLHGCGLEWLEGCDDGRGGESLPSDALIYCDPPYHPQTRVKKKAYRHEFTDDQHRRLLRVVNRLCCSVFVSGYDHPLYRDWLSERAGWSHATWRAGTRGSARQEHLWFRVSDAVDDGATGGLIVDAQKAGANFRERERIKRLVARWKSNFSRRPPAERHAILSALLDESSWGIGPARGDKASAGIVESGVTRRRGVKGVA